MGGDGRAPAELTDWRGRRRATGADDGELFAHPNSRFCTPISQCPVLAPEYEDPAGVPISAILFGGRRRSTIPLVTQARDWNHGVYMGATLSSETTAAAAGKVGVVRRDPMAMLPFIGYHAGDYFRHWIEMGKGGGAGAGDAEKLPKIFYVNWFRRDEDGSFLWPGFGENSRVLKWIVGRLEGTADAVETPIGFVPTPDSLDLSGLDLPREKLEAALRVDEEEWRAEIPQIVEWFEQFGEKLPGVLWAELDALKARLGMTGGERLTTQPGSGDPGARLPPRQVLPSHAGHDAPARAGDVTHASAVGVRLTAMKLRDLLYSAYERRLSASLVGKPLPRHVAVLLDGNRRWAREMGFVNPTDGHLVGAERVKQLLRWCDEVGVAHVTVWLLSTDNLAPAGVGADPTVADHREPGDGTGRRRSALAAADRRRARPPAGQPRHRAQGGAGAHGVPDRWGPGQPGGRLRRAARDHRRGPVTVARARPRRSDAGGGGGAAGRR